MKASELDRKTGLFKRTVTHEQAREAFRQYHHALYHNEPKPALHVPVDPNDADVVLGDYIRQSAERLTELEQALAAFVNYLYDLDEEDCPGGTRLVAKAKELLGQEV